MGEVMENRFPNLFIVGAPKCGTTAMDWYLSQHPCVFMSRVKELHYFGADLNNKNHITKDMNRYLANFSSVTDEIVVGESSVHYLVSENAAKEIYEFNPAARILIMIRNPIDQIVSNYRQLRFTCLEDQLTIERAIEMEGIRASGRSLPPLLPVRQAILYKRIASYSCQIERYFSVFGRDACMVVVAEEMRQDPLGTYRKVESFLQLPAFTPAFEHKNIAKAARFPLINKLLYHPPWPLRKAVSLVMPTHIRRRISRTIVTALSKPPDDGLGEDNRLRQMLAAESDPEVTRLETLLGRALRPLWRDFAKSS